MEEIISHLPNEDEKMEVITRRRSEAQFGANEIFRSGETLVGKNLTKIRDALLVKDGLVEPQKQDLFREQLERTFSTELISAMAKTKSDVEVLKTSAAISEADQDEEEPETPSSVTDDNEDTQ